MFRVLEVAPPEGVISDLNFGLNRAQSKDTYRGWCTRPYLVAKQSWRRWEFCYLVRNSTSPFRMARGVVRGLHQRNQLTLSPKLDREGVLGVIMRHKIQPRQRAV